MLGAGAARQDKFQSIPLHRATYPRTVTDVILEGISSGLPSPPFAPLRSQSAPDIAFSSFFVSLSLSLSLSPSLSFSGLAINSSSSHCAKAALLAVCFDVWTEKGSSSPPARPTGRAGWKGRRFHMHPTKNSMPIGSRRVGTGLRLLLLNTNRRRRRRQHSPSSELLSSRNSCSSEERAGSSSFSSPFLLKASFFLLAQFLPYYTTQPTTYVLAPSLVVCKQC
jgi:hypothetical protein